MSNTFQELLKKQRESTGLSEIIEEAQKETKNNKYGPDERIWKPSVDEMGNGYAVIRFLPTNDSKVPWVKFFDHGFKGDGGWYIETCPTTIGKPCPICEANNKLWNSGHDDDKNIARSRKRRVHFVSNVYVVKDPKNPSAEGKVFLYKYGNKIFQKLMESMEPVFDDDEPMNPFNLFEGADFKIKIKQVGGYWNYDSSEFSSRSPFLGGDEDRILSVLEGIHDIQEFASPDSFRSYNELKSRMAKVLLVDDSVSSNTSSSYDDDDDDMMPKAETAPPPFTTNKKESAAVGANNNDDNNDDDDDDDDLAYYRQVAERMK